MPRIAIILPAYNELLTIAETIKAFYQACPGARIVVIDNNSTDGTAEIAKETLKRLTADGKVIHEHRQGKGNAIRRAFLEIDSDIYVIADADLTYPAERINDLIQPVVNNQADMVVGDRLSGGDYRKENRRRFHNLGNSLVKLLVNILFKAQLKDIMSGYRVLSRRLVSSYPILAEGFQLETDMTLHALDKRFRILEIPIEYKNRPHRSISKLNTFSDGISVLFAITQILRYYRPLFFFGLLSSVFFLSGLVSAIPVFDDWFRFQYIYHLPLAVLAASLEVVAIMTFGVGLVLDSITQQEKRRFEKDLLASSNERSSS